MWERQNHKEMGRGDTEHSFEPWTIMQGQTKESSCWEYVYERNLLAALFRYGT